MAPVVVYTTNFCAYCVRAKELLRRRGIAFEEVSAVDRHDLRQWMAKTSGQHTAPQIFIHRKSVGGFMELAALDRAGKLHEWLADEDPSRPELMR